ncbi:TPA: single-stranded-DNA-specific exonuclease RecJ, partial [Kluyvera ascorbata]|nr:single-stranded-DNA-specific exonuclease RecJ [Kluyvera ascorbata]
IRAGYCRPGIKALLEIANRDAAKLVASDLGFALGPRLNAAGRLDDMSVGVALLLCDNLGEARVLASELDALNQTRKEIEQGMQAEALTLCEQLERSRAELPGGLAMYHPEWHQGVVGILASRIKERFHRPVIAFAPAGNGQLKGSGRSIQGLHMRDALERLDTLHPGLMLKFGGHAMAAGLSLEEERFEEFQRCFGELVTEWLDPALLQGEILSDGELSPQEMTLEMAQMLREAGPWGQMFPEPLFDGRFRLLQQRLVGERHLKVMVEPVGGGPLLDGIAFNVDTAVWPDNGVREVTLAYRLDINEYRGNRSLQLIIDHLWPI